jgi:hypothetical protein
MPVFARGFGVTYEGFEGPGYGFGFAKHECDNALQPVGTSFLLNALKDETNCRIEGSHAKPTALAAHPSAVVLVALPVRK